MLKEIDDKFYDRADAHIHLANSHLAEVGRGKASASMLYATARFSAWVSACSFATGIDMEKTKTETLNYFLEQYRLILEENLDDYIQNFSKYMASNEGDA